MPKESKAVNMVDPFADFAEIYELTHGDKGDDLPLYRELAKANGAPILEIGCGTGRVTLALAEAGYEIFGVDVSENMLKIAAEKHSHANRKTQQLATFARQDMTQLNVPGKRFSLALMPYGEFAHVYERSLQDTTLTAIHKHLKPGGCLVIGMSNWDPQETRINYSGGTITHWGQSMLLKYEGIFEDTKTGGTIIRYIARGYDPSVQTAIHVYVHEITDKDGRLIAKKTNVLPIRYVFRYEMEMLLENAGFTIEHIYGYYDKSEFRFDSKRMIFIARKS